MFTPVGPTVLRVSVSSLLTTTMSDLDADLYGGAWFLCLSCMSWKSNVETDLYGDDTTNEFVVPTSTGSEDKVGKRDDTPRVNTPPAPVSATPSRVDTPPTQPIMTYSEDKEYPSSSAAPIQTYTSRNDAPQPIQTFSSVGGNESYRTTQDNRYKSPQGSSMPTGIAPLPVLERQVRPSEMKDDG